AYVPGAGWHVWDKHRWKRDDDGAAFRAAKETARRIRHEAQEIDDRDIARLVFKWAVHSESAGRIRAMVDLASKGEHDDPGLVKRADTFDRHPHLLVCASGTVDLKTGRIRPSRTADFMTRMSAVSYDRSAMVKRWLRFLDSTFSGDRELIADVQRSVGYSLTGETSEQVVFV